jgi:hypothetical protein
LRLPHVEASVRSLAIAQAIENKGFLGVVPILSGSSSDGTIIDG